MKGPNKHSIINSFGFAFKGLKTGLSERNFRLHILSTVLVILAGLLVGLSATDWVLIFGCIGLVVSMELMNTAIERLVDLVSPEFNEKAGKVKDLGAAAVLVASIAVFIIALIVFIPYLI